MLKRDRQILPQRTSRKVSSRKWLQRFSKNLSISHSILGQLSLDSYQPLNQCRVPHLRCWQVPIPFNIPSLLLPLGLFPSILPYSISCRSLPCYIAFFSQLFFSSFMIWTIFQLSCLVILRRFSLLTLSCQLIPSIFLHIRLFRHYLSSSSTCRVHVSAAYVARLHTQHLANFALSPRLILFD